MSISEMLLIEFDQEMAGARKLLERVPVDKAAWKPHEKSMTLGRLAGHVAELPGWAVHAIRENSLDLAPVISGGYRPYIATSQEDLLKTFDKNVVEARQSLAGASDEHLHQMWSLQMGDKTIMSMPRVAVIRTMFMNHLIHHRAQLGVYLRLNNVPIPGMYGASADDPPSPFRSQQ
jgi:uncharacterized damage-inducible protein DinB